MKQNNFLIAALLLLALAMGCASADKAAVKGTALNRANLEAQTSPTMQGLNPKVDVIKNADGTYTFILSASASGLADSPRMVALRGIQRVTFAIRDRSGFALDSVSTTDIPTSGITNDSVSAITGTASVDWKPRTPPSHGSSVVMRAEGSQGTLVKVVDLPDWASPPTLAVAPISMTLDTRDLGTSLEFILKVERTSASRPDEVLPTGERYRIELFGDAGTLVWSSSAGKMFTQAMTPVYPVSIGEQVVYRETFNGMSSETHARLEPGRYRVVATVPAKPKPYVLREELTWGGR